MMFTSCMLRDMLIRICSALEGDVVHNNMYRQNVKRIIFKDH
jgi:hypothetical protein